MTTSSTLLDLFRVNDPLSQARPSHYLTTGRYQLSSHYKGKSRPPKTGLQVNGIALFKDNHADKEAFVETKYHPKRLEVNTVMTIAGTNNMLRSWCVNWMRKTLGNSYEEGTGLPVNTAFTAEKDHVGRYLSTKPLENNMLNPTDLGHVFNRLTPMGVSIVGDDRQGDRVPSSGIDYLDHGEIEVKNYWSRVLFEQHKMSIKSDLFLPKYSAPELTIDDNPVLYVGTPLGFILCLVPIDPEKAGQEDDNGNTREHAGYIWQLVPATRSHNQVVISPTPTKFYLFGNYKGPKDSKCFQKDPFLHTDSVLKQGDGVNESNDEFTYSSYLSIHLCDLKSL